MAQVNPGSPAGSNGMRTGTNKSGARGIPPQIPELWFFPLGIRLLLGSSPSFFTRLFLLQQLF
jgi:hypothetical protein